jgi:hypothetical protein
MRAILDAEFAKKQTCKCKATAIEIQGGTETNKHINNQTDKQTSKQANKQTSKQTNNRASKKTNHIYNANSRA